jgi:hypothetical protein
MASEQPDTTLEGTSPLSTAAQASTAPRVATGVVVGVDDSQSARAAVVWAAVAAE